jgi:hypothetical protein
MGRAAKTLPIYYLFCAVVQGMVLEDDAGNGEDKYWDTGPGRQRQEERYWDTGNVWQKGDRFHVICLRFRHYGRYGAVIVVLETRLTGVFDDRRPAPVNSLIEAWWFTRHQTGSGRGATGRHSENEAGGDTTTRCETCIDGGGLHGMRCG